LLRFAEDAYLIEQNRFIVAVTEKDMIQRIERYNERLHNNINT